jgi:hypothetical protein
MRRASGRRVDAVPAGRPVTHVRGAADGRLPAIDFEPVDVPMCFGRDAEEAFPILSQLFGWMVRDPEPAAAEQALERMRAVLRDHQTPDGVAFGSASWLITARSKHPRKGASDRICVSGAVNIPNAEPPAVYREHSRDHVHGIEPGPAHRLTART